MESRKAKDGYYGEACHLATFRYSLTAKRIPSSKNKDFRFTCLPRRGQGGGDLVSNQSRSQLLRIAAHLGLRLTRLARASLYWTQSFRLAALPLVKFRCCICNRSFKQSMRRSQSPVTFPCLFFNHASKSRASLWKAWKLRKTSSKLGGTYGARDSSNDPLPNGSAEAGGSALSGGIEASSILGEVWRTGDCSSDPLPNEAPRVGDSFEG